MWGAMRALGRGAGRGGLGLRSTALSLAPCAGLGLRHGAQQRGGAGRRRAFSEGAPPPADAARLSETFLSGTAAQCVPLSSPAARTLWLLSSSRSASRR